jgi:hypothetical protein
MLVHRTLGVVATLGVLASGCDDPELNTDLRPEGPPDVLAVLVMTDAETQLYEAATYCRPNDEKRPGRVGLPDFTTQQVCPDDLSAGVDPVTNAYPDGWYIRIMFDELLDASIETLTEIIDDEGDPTGVFRGSIRAANPVTLQCRSVTNNAFVNVDYDGYYSPAGNRVTWPVGPSLVIKPNDPTLVATGKECQISLNASIVDKQGVPVAAEQRGPYTFSLSPISVLYTDPTDSGDPDDPTLVDALGPYFDNFYFQFNTDVDVTSFCDDEDGSGLCDEGTENFAITPSVTPQDAGGGWGTCSDSFDACSTAADCEATDLGGCESAYVYTYDSRDADDEIGIGYTPPLRTSTTYTFSLLAGTKLRDRCGAETTVPAPTSANQYSITFRTNPLKLNGTNIVSNEVAAPVKKMTLRFSTVLDVDSLDASEYTLTPTPANFALAQVTGGDIVLGGNYAPDTEYTFTLNAGATFEDHFGATYATTAPTTVTWKTQPRVVLTGSSPANNGTINKIVVGQPVGVALSFNANMDVTTFTTDDFTFIDTATNLPVTGTTIGVGSPAAFQDCSAGSLGCQLRVRGNLAPGSYRFTLRQGAQLSDRLGNVYTQEQDRVINFTVANPAPAVQCL